MARSVRKGDAGCWLSKITSSCLYLSTVTSSRLPVRRGVLHPMGMLCHLLLRGNVVFPELLGRELDETARLVWEGALSREHVVEPLCEEPAVERDLAACPASNLLQLRPHGAAKL